MLCRLHRADINRMLQIIDRLCASVHYRQAVSCENSGASMAASPSSDCLVRITMSHHKVVHLPASPQQAAASAAAGQLLRLPGLSHLKSQPGKLLWSTIVSMAVAEVIMIVAITVEKLVIVSVVVDAAAAAAVAMLMMSTTANTVSATMQTVLTIAQ